MKLEKAREILEKEEEDTFMGSEKDWKAAVKLGYGALERVIDYKKAHICGMHYTPLPGETEED